MMVEEAVGPTASGDLAVYSPGPLQVVEAHVLHTKKEVGAEKVSLFTKLLEVAMLTPDMDNNRFMNFLAELRSFTQHQDEELSRQADEIQRLKALLQNEEQLELPSFIEPVPDDSFIEPVPDDVCDEEGEDVESQRLLQQVLVEIAQVLPMPDYDGSVVEDAMVARACEDGGIDAMSQLLQQRDDELLRARATLHQREEELRQAHCLVAKHETELAKWKNERLGSTAATSAKSQDCTVMDLSLSQSHVLELSEDEDPTMPLAVC
jgi:hypothetical protein